jgi:hypothetical protein
MEHGQHAIVAVYLDLSVRTTGNVRAMRRAHATSPQQLAELHTNVLEVEFDAEESEVAEPPEECLPSRCGTDQPIRAITAATITSR